jgi:prevent-host-death family protein
LKPRELREEGVGTISAASDRVTVAMGNRCAVASVRLESQPRNFVAGSVYDYSGHILEGRIMREIQLRDAKASLSAVVDEAMHGKPAVITRHGKRQAVVVGYKEWERLLAS